MSTIADSFIGFQLQTEKIDLKAFEIFEALDYDSSESADYFKEKCSEMPAASLVKLRDKRPGCEARTLLHNAARKGSLAAVLTLIRAGHLVEPVDSCVSKITPLMDAIAWKHMEVAVVLIEAGASLFTQDINGENAFHYLARSGNCKVLRNLLAAIGCTKEVILNCANVRSIKRQLPEDIAANGLMKEILVGLRERGYHPQIFSKNHA